MLPPDQRNSGRRKHWNRNPGSMSSPGFIFKKLLKNCFSNLWNTGWWYVWVIRSPLGLRWFSCVGALVFDEAWTVRCSRSTKGVGTQWRRIFQNSCKCPTLQPVLSQSPCRYYLVVLLVTKTLAKQQFKRKYKSNVSTYEFTWAWSYSKLRDHHQFHSDISDNMSEEVRHLLPNGTILNVSRAWRRAGYHHNYKKRKGRWGRWACMVIMRSSSNPTECQKRYQNTKNPDNYCPTSTRSVKRTYTEGQQSLMNKGIYHQGNRW